MLDDINVGTPINQPPIQRNPVILKSAINFVLFSVIYQTPTIPTYVHKKEIINPFGHHQKYSPFPNNKREKVNKKSTIFDHH